MERFAEIGSDFTPSSRPHRISVKCRVSGPNAIVMSRSPCDVAMTTCPSATVSSNARSLRPHHPSTHHMVSTAKSPVLVRQQPGRAGSGVQSRVAARSGRNESQWAEDWKNADGSFSTTIASPTSGWLRGAVPPSSRNSIGGMRAKVRPVVGVSVPTVVPHVSSSSR